MLCDTGDTEGVGLPSIGAEDPVELVVFCIVEVPFVDVIWPEEVVELFSKNSKLMPCCEGDDNDGGFCAEGVIACWAGFVAHVVPMILAREFTSSAPASVLTHLPTMIQSEIVRWKMLEQTQARSRLADAGQRALESERHFVRHGDWIRPTSTTAEELVDWILWAEIIRADDARRVRTRVAREGIVAGGVCKYICEWCFLHILFRWDNYMPAFDCLTDQKIFSLRPPQNFP